jgi:hypothetical protein
LYYNVGASFISLIKSLYEEFRIDGCLRAYGVAKRGARSRLSADIDGGVRKIVVGYMLMDARVSTRFVLSRPMHESYPYAGYLHEHIADYDFTNATVYICGQSAACTALRDAIRAQAPVDPEFLIEAFD